MAERGREWRIHLGLAIAALICIPAFCIEVSRALGGNTLSWAYVFEWPILFAYAIYMWRQLLRQERGEAPRKKVAETRPEDEAALAEWNAYLAQVHAKPQARPEPPTEN